MAYAYVTFGQAQADLASRLYDSGQQFWAPAELGSYIIEALRTWNALTSFQRGEFPFTLQQGNWFYDLTTLAGSLRSFNVTDANILSQIEYHLLEPQSGAYPISWGGSKQFALSDILGAIQRRRDEVLSATGCQVSRIVVEATPGRIILSDNVIDIRRVGWFPAGFIMTWDSSFPITWAGATFTWDNPPRGGAPTTLRPADPWAKQSFDLGYTTANQAPPQTYLQSAEPPLSFDVDRVPPVPGVYDILTINAGGVVGPDQARLLGLPDDWSWVAKWGALSDLLGRESNAKDSMRASYCIQRFNEALGLMNEASSILALRMNNLPMFIDSITDGDDFNVGWQGLAEGPPRGAYLSGLNLLAVWPGPDSAPYGAVATVVRNFPVPVGLGDSLQVSRDDYDSILDESQHLAAFKMGGEEFAATFPLHGNFIKRASLYNAKLRILGQFERPMYEIAQLDDERKPRYAEPGVLVQ